MSLVSRKDKPTIGNGVEIQRLHCEIDDNPFEDLLMVLDGLCAWIDDALDVLSTNKVLVHCIQGISRSGAIIIAYLMRKHSLTYESALATARKSRAIILPNSGFVDQLRLWEEWQYSIIKEDRTPIWTTKLQYEYWRDNRGIILSRDQSMKQEATRKSMLQLATDARQRQHDRSESVNMETKQRV